MDEIEQLQNPSTAIKHLLLHNMPEDHEVDALAQLMQQTVDGKHIVSIRPMACDWLVEFTDTDAARRCFDALKMHAIDGQHILPELIDNCRLNVMRKNADFDFELRCMCLANYWAAPLFVYGQIVKSSQTQLVGVLMKNMRKNESRVVLMEVGYQELHEIHAKVCEALMMLLIDLGDFPSRHLLVKVNASLGVVGE